jgi:phosphoribosyl 1,2-cyclic phosphodiesterase
MQPRAVSVSGSGVSSHAMATPACAARPTRAVLTNMHLDMDYETLRAELPKGVEPAYDGMTITLDDIA